MIDLKSGADLEKMRDAGRLLAQAMGVAEGIIRPGVSTEEIDHSIRDHVIERGGKLLFYKYKGFPASTCISINEEVVHGIPSPRRRLREGDIVSIDVGVKLRGFCADAARTFAVGNVGPEARRIIDVGSEALARGMQGLTIRMARHLNRALGRRGRVFADRYFSRVLKTPREVRNCLAYVLNNEQRHRLGKRPGLRALQLDPFSSAPTFDGWRVQPLVRPRDTGPPAVVPPQTWLLATGWRRHGLLVPAYVSQTSAPP